jgi:hypothetical protein
VNARTIRLLATTALLTGSLSCAAVQRRSNVPVTVSIDPAQFEHLTDAGDKVSAGDNPRPDGRPDAHFTAHVQGTISGLILTICDDLGNHTGTQWDTIVGQDPIPEGFMNHLGAETWVLGVVGPGGGMLNNSDGMMPETDFPPNTTLQLFAAMRDTVQPGRFVCLTALRPNGAPVSARAEIRGPTGLSE